MILQGQALTGRWRQQRSWQEWKQKMRKISSSLCCLLASSLLLRTFAKIWKLFHVVDTLLIQDLYSQLVFSVYQQLEDQFLALLPSIGAFKIQVNFPESGICLILPTYCSTS